MLWSKNPPIKEGWYFWKRAKTVKNPFRWSVYYFIPEQNNCNPTNLTYEGQLDSYLDSSGTEMDPPIGGLWSLILLKKKARNA